ncbi:MAG TPA: GH1 family beta-glucosidase [Phycisphaerae bacterium]|nr:GH1 family beta-glucosidase [Phycisphaerae bacterium]
MAFPQGFVWGTATASYQIEGAAHEDGKGPSVWDMLCRRPGAIWNGQTGDVASDHYHRWAEDVALMKRLGLGAYRFSISWPRVIPHGTGNVNAKGLAFYDRLVDALLAAGVTPYVTLFHWDYPYDLYCRGGWLNRDSADWFAEYATVLAAKLGDRVGHWMTLNEPQCFVGLGHFDGRHAPGDRLNWAEVLRAAHHALLAHGKGVQAIRAASPGPCQVGFAPVGVVRIPATDSAADVEAARADMFAVTARNQWNNTWWMDPVFFGTYPADGLALYAADLPPIRDGDLETIRQPLDFFGANIYTGSTVRAGAGGQPEAVPDPVGIGLTGFKWPVTPAALYWGPRLFFERYRLPVYITENGMSGTDWVGPDGAVHDAPRIDYTAEHLAALGRAVDDGVDVRGYFHWSLMDNFEWAEGYKERFGLIHTDFVTGKRTLKDSALWYKDVIAANGANLSAKR